MSMQELATVTRSDRLRVAKERTAHPGPRGHTFLAFTAALGAGLAGFAAPASWGLWQVAAGAAGIIPGVFTGRVLLLLSWYVRGSSEVLKGRLLEEATAREAAEAQQAAGTPSPYQLTRDFEEQLANARDAVEDFTFLVGQAWRGYRRKAPQSPPMDWHEALPEDPAERSETLEGFADGLAAGGAYFISRVNHTRYNRTRRRVETFFNTLNALRLSAPDFYEETVTPRVKTQQYSILHLLTFLQCALAERDFGEDYEPAVKPPWLALWEEWSADPPDHKHRAALPRRRVVVVDRDEGADKQSGAD